MKPNFLRAVALAGFSLLATAAFVAPTPAFAAEKENAPKVSRTVGKALADVKKMMDAKDWPGLIAKLKDVQSSASEDYDKYVVNTYLAIAYFQAGDHKSAADAFVAAAKIPNIPESDHEEAVHKALMLLSDIKDYAGVIDLAKTQIKPDAKLGDDILRLIGISYFYQNDYPNALAYGQKAVEQGSVGGKVPPREAYELILLSQGRMKDIAGQTKIVATMAGLYGQSDDWAHALDFTFASFQAKNKQANATAMFFLYRLRLVVKADTEADDYFLAASLAIDQNSPGDALKALNLAKASGKYNAKKCDPLFNRANQDAKKDQPALAQAEAISAKSPKGDPSLSVAESYFGYGKYADAERVAQRAVDKGSSKQNEAYLLLGAAKVMLNKNAEATAILAKITSDPYDKVANLWSLYANRKYGEAAAQPVAN